MKLLLQAVPLVVLLAVTACHRTEPAGPPVLRLGRDECGECGMTIHEERSAAAILVERDGRREHVVFDDIGCMLDKEGSEDPGLKVIGRYVHDHSSSSWIAADKSVFLGADSSVLRTPMGSGIAAFVDLPGAEAGKQQFGGEIFDHRSIAAWRRERMDERRTAPGG